VCQPFDSFASLVRLSLIGSAHVQLINEHTNRTKNGTILCHISKWTKSIKTSLNDCQFLLIRQTLVERADACCLNEPSWADIPMRARYGLEHRNMSHTVNRPAKAFFLFCFLLFDWTENGSGTGHFPRSLVDYSCSLSETSAMSSLR
jgi:hypothetical protein